ncbi:MAG TPA: phosphoribosyltransferase family protein [Candidatus Binataceae bacterium]|jgi:aspartate carbamoyltransferase catalytic subunit
MNRVGKLDLVSIEDLATAEIERIFALADEFSAALAERRPLTLAGGLIMATLFYEPSTRTRLSFESAMHRLGGSVISSADMHSSSAAKGESLADTVRVVSAYADLIVMRHPRDGAARVAADYSRIPIINAGDGSREHPTQTLCDLYILRQKKGRLRGLTVALCGDLKHGRTVHSLVYALARFGANIVTVPSRGGEVPDYVLARLAAERSYNISNVSIDELKRLAGGLDALYLTPSAPHQMALFTGDISVADSPPPRPPALLDAFYVTRFQKERRAAGEQDDCAYVRFDSTALETRRTQQAVVMHPLPRTDELAYELDSDPRAIYFEQAAAGVPVRMALIAWMIENAAADRQPPASPDLLVRFRPELVPRCANPNCITRHEGGYLAPKFRVAPTASRDTLALRCDFCERELRIDYVGNSRSHKYYRFEQSIYGYTRQWIEEGTAVFFESVKQAEEHGYEPYRRGPQRELMKPAEVAASIDSLASQIIADVSDLSTVSLVGVVSHGATLAIRLREIIQSRSGVAPPCAGLDIYKAIEPVHGFGTAVPFEVGGRIIILVDDVINSGWTVQRAMATIWKIGRPAALKLAVLIDRGHRSLPIRPNYVGKNVPTQRLERVQVRLNPSNPPADVPGSKSLDRVLIYSMLDSMAPAEEAS